MKSIEFRVPRAIDDDAWQHHVELAGEFRTWAVAEGLLPPPAERSELDELL